MKLFIFVLPFVLAFGTCLQRIERSEPTPAATVSPAPTPAMDADLHREVGEIAKDANGKAGVYAVVIETGEWVGLNENERFAMQSIVKVPISMAVLKMVDEGKLRLDQLVSVHESDMTVANQRSPIRDKSPQGTQMAVEDLIRDAIVESDGTASDVLQRVAGGAAGVQAYVESLGIRDMKIVWSHKEFGSEWSRQYDNWATPRASVELLLKLFGRPAGGEHDHNIDASYHRILDFMTESNNPDDRILGMLPEGTVVAHKTGTGGRRDGVTSATNDVGIITLPNGNHIAIAVYLGDASGGPKERADTIARIAKTVFDKWSDAKEPESSKAANHNERNTLN